MELLQLALVVVLAYLIGSIPTGLIVARLNGVDLTSKGSGKTGATNTMNALGIGAGATVLAFDLVKGVMSVLLAYLFPYEQTMVQAIAVTCAGAAAILGHNYSIWVRLITGRWGGGRGIVTALGAMVLLHPLVVLAAVVVGATFLAITRYVVLGALAGTIGAVVVAVILVSLGSLSGMFLPAVLLWALLVIVGFQDNIERLLQGAEPKLGRSG